MNSPDSLCLYKLSNKQKTFIPNCKKYQFIKAGAKEWVACILTTSEFLLCDLKSGEIEKAKDITDFYCKESGNTIILANQSSVDSTEYSLRPDSF